jgi:hypothetical protein
MARLSCGLKPCLKSIGGGIEHSTQPSTSLPFFRRRALYYRCEQGELTVKTTPSQPDGFAGTDEFGVKWEANLGGA